MRTKTLLVYATCCLLWGSTWLVIKLGLTELPPFLFGGVRMLIAFAMLTPLALREPLRHHSRATWRNIVMMGALQLGLSYALTFYAQGHLDSGLAAVLFSTYPIWAALFAHALLPAEPLSVRKGVATALGVGGILVLEAPALRALASGGDVGRGGVPPVALLVVLSAMVSAFGNVLQKKRLADVTPAVNLWVQTLVGGLLLLSLHGVFQPHAPAHFSLKAVGCLLYLAAFGTVATFLCLFWLLKRVSMVAIGVIPLADTMIAVCLGTAVLGEQLGWRQAAGAVLVFLGAAAANLEPAPKPAPACAPGE
ncbi:MULTISPECIES: DMT family transporter [Myxococcaceae]|uniref:DMT family transporter n=1 Tax=Myxococcaceae TaxID=31 RepID=UPI00188F59C7|nr:MULTISPECIES: EamA family transporter [Myxococcaceae]MBF5045464.1 EamA family transporter [Simulacricoccus sp. 17bor-14]